MKCIICEIEYKGRKGSKCCSRACGVEYRKKIGSFGKSEEQRKKISESRKGTPAWNKGKTHSAEQIEKFKESVKKAWTEERRQKQRERQKEVWSNPELLAKHSARMLVSSGREEVRQKISDSLKVYSSTVSDEEWLQRYSKQCDTKAENGTQYYSKGENELREFLLELGVECKKLVIGKGATRFEIDLYIEDKKLGIEYNGIYYHSANGINKRGKSYHINKNTIANEHGIELMHIWEDQWIHKKDILKDIIRARLGKLENDKIYARKCEIREIDTKQYKDFCIANHIQGYRAASVRYGLFYQERLVQISSFNKAHSYGNSGAGQFEWEWVRGCISANNVVIGGTSKLLKHFIITHQPKNILCYSDWDLFSGKGYEEAGFDFIGLTGPSKFYVTKNNAMQRIHRNPYAYKEYKQLVNDGKLFECYGCGSKKYVWTRKETN